jgi:hypothetical protein
VLEVGMNIQVDESKIRHDYFLDRLIDNLEDIGEDPYRVKWMMKDGIWMPDNSTSRFKFCDLILIYYDDYGIPIELKGGSDKKSNGVKQIISGREFIEDELNLDCPYGKFVTYGSGRYSFTKLDFSDE